MLCKLLKLHGKGKKSKQGFEITPEGLAPVVRHFYQTDSIVLKTDHRISQSCCFLFAQDQITKLRAEVTQLKEREESLKSQVGPVLTRLCDQKRSLL